VTCAKQLADRVRRVGRLEQPQLLGRVTSAIVASAQEEPDDRREDDRRGQGHAEGEPISHVFASPSSERPNPPF
jgi:hypothetical protein